MKTKMFDVVTKTWNPITGCKHNCVYCWAKRFARRLKHTERYRNGFIPRLNEKEFGKKFNGGFVFVCDMGDLFGNFTPDEWIEKVLNHIRKFPKTKFLLLTKNPSRLLNFDFPENVVLGATVETDLTEFDTPSRFKQYDQISKAPSPTERLDAMVKLDWYAKFLSIEPILDFSSSFWKKIEKIEPSVIYVGYDNYSCKLPEPTLSKTLNLIDELRNCGFRVIEKSVRKAWFELNI